MQAGARLEWLPLEALCYSGCLAENRLTMKLAPGTEMLGWDVTAFGLPAAGLPYAPSRFCQHIEVPGVWLERACIAASDTLLMDSPLGLAEQRCMASIFFVAGRKLERHRRQAALDVAREVIKVNALRATAGATHPNVQVVVVRVLTPLVEPAMALLRQAWRGHFWQQPPSTPRIWSMLALFFQQKLQDAASAFC